MNTISVDPAKLIPYPGNSKEHPEDQVAAIAKSIETFGFDQPIVVDQNYVIIKGHGRTLAALKLGLTEVPVVVREVSENDARFLREVDNQIQSAEWDKENLATELHELKDLGKLEFTLYDEGSIPALPQFVVGVQPTEFDLSTKHTCCACGYKW